MSQEPDWTEAAPESDTVQPGMAFASLPEFVEDFFVEVAVRHTLPENWCRQWWDHEEAVLRLEALWDAFETLRVEPGTGTAVWIRDYLDPTVAALTDPETSPFRKCRARHGEHVVEEPWPVTPAPAGMFQRYA